MERYKSKMESRMEVNDMSKLNVDIILLNEYCQYDLQPCDVVSNNEHCLEGKCSRFDPDLNKIWHKEVQKTGDL